jgi:hypothetical protein
MSERFSISKDINMETKFEQLLNKFEQLVQRFESAQSGGSVAPTQGNGPAAPQSKLLKDFDASLNPKIKALEEAATALGGEIITTIVGYIDY